MESYGAIQERVTRGARRLQGRQVAALRLVAASTQRLQVPQIAIASAREGMNVVNTESSGASGGLSLAARLAGVIVALEHEATKIRSASVSDVSHEKGDSRCSPQPHATVVVASESRSADSTGSRAVVRSPRRILSELHAPLVASPKEPANHA